MQLHRDREKFEEAGARLVLIGQGTPEEGAHFLKEQRVDLPLLVDKSRESYRRAGTKTATFSELLGPVVVAKGILSSIRNRKPQGRTVGHPAQLGGVLVITPDGSIPYAHLSDDASDNPPNEEVLKAVRAVTAESSRSHS
jgi:peroxiredoxin